MKPINTIFKAINRIYLPLLLILFIGAFFPIGAAENDISSSGVSVKDGLMAAYISSAALKDVLEDIRTVSGIGYRGDEALLNEKITVSFEDLTIEESLRRILNRFDYTMMFNSEGMPTSVYIYGKGDNSGDIRTTRHTTRSRSRIDRVEQTETRKPSRSTETTSPRFKTSTLGPVKPVRIPVPPEPIDPDNPTKGAAPRGSY